MGNEVVTSRRSENEINLIFVNKGEFWRRSADDFRLYRGLWPGDIEHLRVSRLKQVHGENRDSIPELHVSDPL